MSGDDQPFNNLRPFLVNPDQIKQELMCGICKQLVIQPQECQQCEHIFCSNSIYSWLVKTKHCPMNCSQNNLLLKMPHKLIHGLMSQLQIRCVNKNCEVTMKYEELKNHLKNCDKMTYKCSQGCEQIIKKNEFDEHLKICEHRILYCQNCQIEYKFIEKHDCINFLKEKIKNLEKENQDLNNQIIDANIKIEDQEQRIQKLTQQNKNSQTDEMFCDKGHNLQWIKPKYNLQCDKCAQYTEVIRYECNMCNYFICQKCLKPICKNQQCPKLHNLVYAQQATPNLVCDLCNRYIQFLQCGVYSDKECDFDLCEECFKKFYSLKNEDVEIQI